MKNTHSTKLNLHLPQPSEPWPPSRSAARLNRASLMKLAIIINSLADSPSEPHLPIAEVHAAAQEGRLLPLLVRYAGRRPDFSFLQSPPGTFDELNSTLHKYSVILQGREFLRTGVSRNGYCFALALVLHAAREWLPPLWPDHTVADQN